MKKNKKKKKESNKWKDVFDKVNYKLCSKDNVYIWG